mmetsp:Transcript_17875/g.27639  ORF Transcript_17875/g.27639 Transcript_17875/m.27639 type:complete len:89 (+) Transcript_17875:272-538(+)
MIPAVPGASSISVAGQVEEKRDWRATTSENILFTGKGLSVQGLQLRTSVWPRDGKRRARKAQCCVYGQPAAQETAGADPQEITGTEPI